MPNWNDPRVRTIWSTRTLEILLANLVYATGFNQNYRGEVAGKGQALEIFSYPIPDVEPITVPATALAGFELAYQRMTAIKQTLFIDHDEGWEIAEDRTLTMLTDDKAFDELSDNAAWAIRDKIDRQLASELQSGAGIINPFTGGGVGGAVIIGHGATSDMTAYGMIERLREEFAVNSVPDMDLHVYIPPWMMSILRLDVRFTGFGTDMNRATARGERIIELAGITIHETVNVFNGAGTAFTRGRPDDTAPGNGQNRILANWKGAATFAPWKNAKDMIDYMPAGRNIASHDNLMRARSLWGSKVTISEAVAVQTVQLGEYEP